MDNPNKCRATGKSRFPDPGSAKEAISRIKNTQRFYDHIQGKRVNRRAGKKAQCRYYYCKHCHGWHLTSKEKSTSLRKFKEERKIQLKDVVITTEQAAEWKKDSIPFPTEKLNKMTEEINFIDAQEMALLHPDTFEAPSADDLAKITVGDYVKICPGEERFWCRVEEIDHGSGRIMAAVANTLIFYPWAVGEELDFETRHIYQILKNHEV